MSAPAITAPVVNTGWPLWRSQVWSIFFHDIQQNFVTKRGFWIYLLALAPAALVWIHSFVVIEAGRSRHDLTADTNVMATMFQMFLLRPAIFFGCVGIFVNLFRGEVIQKSLHYYLLSPVRREVLVLSKYLSGFFTAVCFFGGSVALTFFGMFFHFATEERAQFMAEAGWYQLSWYAASTVLACMAWGAILTWFGIRWKNPVIPAVALLLWESFHSLFPWWAAKLSVLHYLQSLAPVTPNFRGGPGLLLGSTADPEPAWLAIAALIALACAGLSLAMYQLKRTEISYSSD